MSGQDPARSGHPSVAAHRRKRWFAERLRKTRRFRHDAPGRQQARMAGTPRAKRRLALLPGQNGRVDQLRTVMQEMSERFSVRHTASA
jgi:hypothetical protein